MPTLVWLVAAYLSPALQRSSFIDGLIYDL